MKTHTLKKAVNVLLSLCMVLTMLPANAMAKEGEASLRSICKGSDSEASYCINEPFEFYLTETPTKIVSSDKSIATVEKYYDDVNKLYSFVITGHKAGTTRLKITDKNLKSYMTVHIRKPVEPTKDKIKMKVGTTYKTQACVFTDYYQNYISVSSSDSSIVSAKLDKNPDSSYRLLTLKAKKVGTATITLKNPTHKNYAKIKVTVKEKYTSVPVEESTGTKRALIIGEDYNHDMFFADVHKDVDSVARLCKSTGYSSVKKQKNPSKKEIKKAIQETFKDAKKNDVSLFYFEGYGTEKGELLTQYNDGMDEMITPTQLASWLSAVPGKIIVILDSDHSGKVIGKDGSYSASKSGEELSKTLKNANQCIIDAFDAKEKIFSTSSKAGVLCHSKFKVLTACKANENVWHVDESIFAKTLLQGAGVNESGILTTKAPADYNKDKKITLDECTDYLSQFAYPYFQEVQCYPEKSGFVIFQK